MTARVDVTAFGARGDGHTNDMPSIRKAIDGCRAGDELVFPPSSPGYFVGAETAFAIPAGVRLTGVARLAPGFAQEPALVPAAQPIGLVLVPDAQGMIDASRGHVFDGDGGVVIGTYSPIVFPGGGVSLVEGSVLLATQVRSGEFWAIRAARSGDGLASIEFAEWILREQFGPLPVSGAHTLPLGTIGLTFDGAPWGDRSGEVSSGLDLLVTEGAGAGQSAPVIAHTAESVIIRAPKWATMPDATTRVTIGTSLLDCDIVTLSDGAMVSACEQIGQSGSAIRFARSSDGGRSWAATARISAVDQALPKPAPGGPLVGAVKLHRMRHPVPGMHGHDHVAALFCITIVRPDGRFVSDYVIALSADAFQSVASMRLLGVSHVDGVDNEINDGNQGALYERDDRPGLLAMLPLWTGSQPDSNRIYQVECDAAGVPLHGEAPHLVTVVPISTSHGGSFPEVAKLTTGEYGLYFSGTDFTHRPWDHGAMYFMSSPDGSLGSFAGIRRLWLQTGFPNGYGFAHAIRLANGQLVIVISAVTSPTQSQIRVFRHYAA